MTYRIRTFIVLSVALLNFAGISGNMLWAADHFQVREVIEGRGIIWGMTFIDNDTLLFTEKEGGVFLLDIRKKKITAVAGVPKVLVKGQGGLLDVATHPDYPSQPVLFFTYVSPVGGNGATTLARAVLEEERLIEWQDLLVTRSITNTSRHYGSRITFDDQEHLFFTVGDRGVRPNGQDLTNHAGTVIRLNLDGSLPEDNPFVGKGSVLPEIYSYGHRNPQGIVYDRKRKVLWAIEHGPRGGDELNRILPGHNYGWPVISYGKEYWGPVAVGEGTHKAGMEQPVKIYIPSIAPSSLLLYTGEAFPEWQGDLLAGALAMTHLNRIILDDAGRVVGEERLLIELDERIRDVIQGPQGDIYISTDSGRILQLSPHD